MPNGMAFIFFSITKKENCHPLLSRKRSLAQVVSSPSYKPVKTEHKEIKSNYEFDRRKTFVISFFLCPFFTQNIFRLLRKGLHVQ